MKIEPTITVTLSGRAITRSLFDGIKKGAEVQARVVEQVGKREAIIEIGGRKIHAEFPKGVPAGSTITLKLDAVAGNSYYFKLSGPGSRDAFIRQIMEMTVFDMSAIRKNIIRGLGGALAKHPSGIFELNALLLNLPKADRKDEGLARFLNHLAKRGFDGNALSDLSLLLSGASVRSRHFQTLLLILGFGEDRLRKLASATTAERDAMVDRIIREIGSIEDRETKEAVIRQLLEMLTSGGAQEEYVTGEFAFPGEDGFRPVRYLGAGRAWLFSADFSSIGKIEIAARETGKDFTISIFCASDEALDAVKKDAGELMRRLEHIHQKMYINFFNTQQAINKVVEINSYYSLNSEFDIRA
jgi:hypothetical protein